ncbi:MAG: hypothetical protein AVDCRST_MAG59-978, partial [uncultured Thermomicrobiales bacterium]
GIPWFPGDQGDCSSISNRVEKLWVERPRAGQPPMLIPHDDPRRSSELILELLHDGGVAWSAGLENPERHWGTCPRAHRHRCPRIRPFNRRLDLMLPLIRRHRNHHAETPVPVRVDLRSLAGVDPTEFSRRILLKSAPTYHDHRPWDRLVRPGIHLGCSGSSLGPGSNTARQRGDEQQRDQPHPRGPAAGRARGTSKRLGQPRFSLGSEPPAATATERLKDFGDFIHVRCHDLVCSCRAHSDRLGTGWR